jgi:hypothetical protein
MKDCRVESPIKTSWKGAISRTILTMTDANISGAIRFSKAFIDLTGDFYINTPERLQALNCFIDQINKRHIYLHPEYECVALTANAVEVFYENYRKDK